MIIQVDIQADPKVGRYFQAHELFNPTDPGLGATFPIDTVVVGWADALREAFGTIVAYSGYRSAKHPDEVNKKYVGAHQRGQAIDIQPKKIDVRKTENAIQVMAYAYALGCRRFGWNPGRTTIHIGSLDVRSGTEDCWTYDGSDPYTWMRIVIARGEELGKKIRGGA